MDVEASSNRIPIDGIKETKEGQEEKTVPQEHVNVEHAPKPILRKNRDENTKKRCIHFIDL